MESGVGWKVCGSVPAGASARTCTVSPPTFATRSARTVLLVTTETGELICADWASRDAATNRSRSNATLKRPHRERLSSCRISRGIHFDAADANP